MGSMSNMLVEKAECVMMHLTKICEEADIFDELQEFIMKFDPTFENGSAYIAEKFEEQYFDLSNGSRKTL